MKTSNAYVRLVGRKHFSSSQQRSAFHRKQENRINEATEVDKRTDGYKRKEYLCLISTDVNLDENEIVRIYGKHWDIEVFLKVCKSYLNLSREFNDNRSLGELFLYFSDEISDITWIQAFQMLLQMFRTMLSDNTELSDKKINELVDTFMNTLPVILKAKLQAA